MKVYTDHKHKVKFPIKVSYKYDGVFCKVINKTAYSKNDKLFKAIHILDYPDNTEGELYNHELTFEDIISGVKRDTPNELTKLMLFYPHEKIPKYDINNEEELYIKLQEALGNGYEGLVLDTNYGKLKLKPTYDEEFKIISFVEGKGKLKNKMGKLMFENFGAPFKGFSYPHLEELWDRREELIGKLATVQYQNKTSKGRPRFPKVIAIRDYE